MNFTVTMPNIITYPYFWYFLVAGSLFTFASISLNYVGFSTWYFGNKLRTMTIVTLGSLFWPITIPIFYFGVIRK